MMQPTARSFLLAALALPVLAQDPAPKTPPPATAAPAAAAPMMVLKTSQNDLATMVAMSFEFMDELPELADGEHYVLTLSSDRELKVGTGKGDVGVLDMTADPGLLMDAFADEIEAGKPMVNGTLTMVLQQGGIQPKDSAAMIKSLFDFPRQLAKVSLRMTGDPENPAEKGVDIAFEIEGKADSGFVGFLDTLKPCSLGAPVVPIADAAMQMQVSLAPESLKAMFAPWKDLVVNLTNQGEEQRAKAGAMYDQWIAAYDGGIGGAFGVAGSGAILCGITDGAKVQQMMASEDYAAMMKSQQLPNRDMEMEVQLGVLEHRGSKLGRTKITGGEPNPLMPDGTMQSYFGVVGNFLGITLGGGEGDAKAMVDAVADKKVTRAALPNGAFVHLVMDLRAFVAMAQPDMGAEVDESMPKQLTMSFGKGGKALTLHVHVQ